MSNPFPGSSPNLEILLTEDGSHTLMNKQLNATYHSMRGAVQESKHVFIQAGLERHFELNKSRQLTILEIGFGTGLNALLALEWSKQNRCILNYTSIESYPIEISLARQLNYPSFLQLDPNEFENLHFSSWGQKHEICPTFSFLKFNTTLESFHSSTKFDLIFFDAFGPGTQPELWDPDIFEKITNMMAQGGILTTFSAKGDVRRALIDLGLEVEKLKGPPGKRHMLRGAKYGVWGTMFSQPDNLTT